jgi:hypothetical protein
VPAGVNGEVITQESIVPGLDFANHAASHSCRWTLWGGPRVSADYLYMATIFLEALLLTIYPQVKFMVCIIQPLCCSAGVRHSRQDLTCDNTWSSAVPR